MTVSQGPTSEMGRELTLPDGRTIPEEAFDPQTMILGGVSGYLGGQRLTLVGYEQMVAQGFTAIRPWEIGEDFISLERGERWTMVGITPDLAAALARGCEP